MDLRRWFEGIRRAIEERRERSAVARRLDVYVGRPSTATSLSGRRTALP